MNICKLFLSFLLFNSFITYSQSSTLRVLGQSNYTEYSETNVAIIYISDEDSETKEILLKKKIDSIGFKNELIPINDTKEIKSNGEMFKFEEDNLDLFGKFLSICSDLKIRLEDTYFKMPPHEYDDEDKYAFLALKNAESQAKIITKNLNYNIVQILSIDDETTYADPIFDFIDRDSERGRIVIELIQILGSRNPNETKSKQSVRYGGYNLWVTFEIEPE